MPLQWARLQPEASEKIRHGAWYRVLKLGPIDVVLDVNRKPTAVPRSVLQIAQTPPAKWSVVPSPRHNVRFPLSWGSAYAVCPGCRERAPIVGKPDSMRCHKCNGLFDVAWIDNKAAGATA